MVNSDGGEAKLRRKQEAREEEEEAVDDSVLWSSCS